MTFKHEIPCSFRHFQKKKSGTTTSPTKTGCDLASAIIVDHLHLPPPSRICPGDSPVHVAREPNLEVFSILENSVVFSRFIYAWQRGRVWVCQANNGKSRLEIKGLHDFFFQVNFFFGGVVIANHQGQNELSSNWGRCCGIHVYWCR